MRPPNLCLLEEVAKRWVPGEGPAEIQPLTAGLVNRTYRVVRDGCSYSLRLADADTRNLGVDRHWECRIRKEAGAAGVAAAVRHCDPAAGILVADWEAGRTWSAEETCIPENVDAMAQLLRRVHALVIPQPARLMKPVDWIKYYSTVGDEIDSTPLCGRQELQAAAQSRLSALGPASGCVVCHSDLHRLNVLIGKRPLLLDWEYAHVSEPLWDLAGWACNNDWPAALAERLLASYRAGQVTSEDSRRLEHLRWLYDYVCLLWSDRYAQQQPARQGEAVQARAVELALRLKSQVR